MSDELFFPKEIPMAEFERMWRNRHAEALPFITFRGRRFIALGATLFIEYLPTDEERQDKADDWKTTP